MRIVSLRLPPELERKLATAARKRGISKSAVARHALEFYFANGAESHRLSAYDLASDLDGVVEDAPRDLSTAHEHMKGYGE